MGILRSLDQKPKAKGVKTRPYPSEGVVTEAGIWEHLFFTAPDRKDSLPSSSQPSRGLLADFHRGIDKKEGAELQLSLSFLPPL